MLPTPTIKIRNPEEFTCIHKPVKESGSSGKMEIFRLRSRIQSPISYRRLARGRAVVGFPAAYIHRKIIVPNKLLHFRAYTQKYLFSERYYELRCGALKINPRGIMIPTQMKLRHGLSGHQCAQI